MIELAVIIAVITAGAWIFDAVGGGWFGYLLTGLLFLVALIFANFGSLVYVITREWYRNMPLEERIEHLSRRYPDVDWAALLRNREAVEKALAEQEKVARQAKNSIDGSLSRKRK